MNPFFNASSYFNNFLRAVFVMLVLGGVIFVATKFSHPIKENVSNVLGTRISENSTTLPSAIKEDVDASVETAKETAMETDMKDLLDYQRKINKVVSDYHTVQRELQKKADDFFSVKKEK